MRLIWIRAVTITQLVLLLQFLSGDAFPIEETAADGTELYTEVMTVTVLDTDKEGSLLESSMEHIQSPDAGQSEAESEHHSVPTSNTTHTSASTKIPTYSVSTPETIHHGVTPSNTVLDTVSTMGPTSTIASSSKSLHQSVTPNNTQPSSASVMTTSHSKSTSSEVEHQSATPNNTLQRPIHTMAPTQTSATSSSKTMEPSLADVTELYTEIITVLIIDKEGSLPNNSLGRMESADATQRSPSTREALHHSVTPSDTIPDTVSTVQPARTIARSSETAHQRMTPNTNQHSSASTSTNASTSEMIHSSVTPSDLAPPISRHPDTSNTPDAFPGALHNTSAPAHNTGFSNDDINVTDTEVTPNNAADTGDALHHIPNVSGVEHIESDNDQRSNDTVSVDSTSHVSDLSQVPSSSLEESLFTETYTQMIEIEEMEEIDDGNLGNGNVSRQNDADVIHSDSTPRAPVPGVKSTHSDTHPIANNTLSARDETDHTASYTDFTQANTDTLSVNTQFTPHKESVQENTDRSPSTSRSTPNTSNPTTKSSMREALSSSFDTLFTETYTEVIEIMEMEENDGNS